MARRSTKKEIADRDRSIIEILRGDHPQSVRHVFYRLTDPAIPGHVEKTQSGYEKVQRRALALRRDGRVPRSWVADASRYAHWNEGYNSISDFLGACQALYRRSLWQDAAEVVEVWCEARSMVGVLNETCREYRVPLFPAGGYSSESFLYEAAGQMVRQGRPVVAYHVGDYDDDGLSIGRDVERRVTALMAEETTDPPPFRFVRLAVNEDQVRRWNLPAKTAKETRRKEVLNTVEAESIPAGVMRQILRDAFDGHLEPGALARTKEIEQAERETLRQQSEFLSAMSQYGGKLTLTDGDGDEWEVGDDGIVGMKTE